MPAQGWQPDSPVTWRLYGAEAIWRLNHRIEGDLPALACDAMLEGLNSPALALLAGEQRTAIQADLGDLLLNALIELGKHPPPHDELADRVLRYRCWQIVTERTTAIRGARAIELLLHEPNAPEAASEFSSIDDQWTGGFGDDKKTLAQRIGDLAGAVLKQTPAGN